MWQAGVLIRAAAGSRPLATRVRYLPLGSPWATSNRSYVHVPSGPWPVASCTNPDMRVVGWVRYREGAIPGTTQHPPGT